MTNPLADLARRVQRLTIDRRDPERFFADKSEIAHDLRRLAKTLPANGLDRIPIHPEKERPMAFHPKFKRNIERTVRMAVDEAVAANRDFDAAVAAVTPIVGAPPNTIPKTQGAVFMWALRQLGVPIEPGMPSSAFRTLFEQHSKSRDAESQISAQDRAEFLERVPSANRIKVL